jgi:hypothetical protein
VLTFELLKVAPITFEFGIFPTADPIKTKLKMGADSRTSFLWGAISYYNFFLKF